MPAELEGHAQRAQRSASGSSARAVGQRDVRAAAREQLGGGDAASRGAHDGHALPLD